VSRRQPSIVIRSPTGDAGGTPEFLRGLQASLRTLAANQSAARVGGYQESAQDSPSYMKACLDGRPDTSRETSASSLRVHRSTSRRPKSLSCYCEVLYCLKPASTRSLTRTDSEKPASLTNNAPELLMNASRFQLRNLLSGSLSALTDAKARILRPTIAATAAAG
jgi:hypothetical protein